VTLTWDGQLVDLVSSHRADPKFGARPVLRAIQELVAEPLGNLLLSREQGKRLSFHTVIRSGAVAFEEQTSIGEQSTPSPAQERV
jgi:ATP-dependent Clp protease ATP-binding subunit ClpA